MDVLTCNDMSRTTTSFESMSMSKGSMLCHIRDLLAVHQSDHHDLTGEQVKYHVCDNVIAYALSHT